MDERERADAGPADGHDPRVVEVYEGWPQSSIPEDSEAPGMTGDVYGR